MVDWEVQLKANIIGGAVFFGVCLWIIKVVTA